VVTTLTAAITSATLQLGQSAVITLSARDQRGQPIATGAVSWASSSAAVASVENGTVTAVGVGQASITATAAGVSAAVSVTVTRPPAVLTTLAIVLPTSLPVGGAVAATLVALDQLGVSMSPGDVAWSTSAEAVASVSTAGVVTGVSEGTVVVVARAAAIAAQAGLTITPFNFGNGTRLVPSQVPPGRYRSVNAASASCYWERLSGFGGTSAERLANDLGGGPRIIEVLATDAAIRVQGCQPWAAIRAPVTASPTAPLGVGVYVVGLDVSPGTWRADTPSSNCYWARRRGFTQALGEIIANDFGATPSIVTIADTDVGFETSGCGDWVRVP
jgi:hypothetical protein